MRAGAFALAVAFLVANRAREYYASLKSKEEMAAELAENRRAMQAAPDGESFAGADAEPVASALADPDTESDAHPGCGRDVRNGRDHVRRL